MIFGKVGRLFGIDRSILIDLKHKDSRAATKASECIPPSGVSVDGHRGKDDT